MTKKHTHKQMPGMKFGRLLVIERVVGIIKNSPRFKCVCDCGKSFDVDARHLRNGATSSCGCANRENLTRLATTHGKSKTPEFKIWMDMKFRCNNERCSQFINYGGRGILVCERWNKSFQFFLEDMGERPNNTTLERIDNNGNYDPKNCRWASKLDQALNRRTNVFIEYNGKKLTKSQWADAVGISKSTLHNRLVRGWSIEKTLLTPV